MIRFRWLSAFILFTVLFSSCRKEVPTLEGIDSSLWVKDRNGCLRYRKGVLDAIKSQKEKLLALNEVEIVYLLGRPDENELYKRNQKFFYYNILPSKDCTGKADSLTSRLVIRFNAMGLAKEITIEP